MPEIDIKKELSGLNEKQRLAVETIDGPLLVIAGPGTGKTHLLSLRVSNILLSTDISPSNILCLTFSESGAEEMKIRLEKMIGQTASEIEVSTYHSFGLSVLRAASEYYPQLLEYRPITDLEQDIILRKIQEMLPYSVSLKREIYLKNIKTLIGKFKKALILPQTLSQIVEANTYFLNASSKITVKYSDDLRRIKKITSLKTFKALFSDLSNLKLPADTFYHELKNEILNEMAKAIESAEANDATKPLTAFKAKYLEFDSRGILVFKGIKQHRKLKEFCAVFQAYNDELADRKLNDYDDMIIRAIKVLDEIPELKYNLQEKYQYILLDEFQDTNKAQFDMVLRLTDNPVNEGRPNIMAVGDDDQAIYAFQGADHSRFIEFRQAFIDTTIVFLDINYRSTNSIIEFSRDTADRIETSLVSELPGVNKSFKSGTKNKGRLELHEFNDQDAEFEWISQEIEQLPENHTTAIIAPKHTNLESISRYLQDRNIGFSYERRDNLLEKKSVMAIIEMLRLIDYLKKGDAYNSNASLSKILGYDFWKIEPEKIWYLSWAAYSTRANWVDLTLKDNELRDIAKFFIKLSTETDTLTYEQVLDRLLGIEAVLISPNANKTFNSPLYEFYMQKDNYETIELFDGLDKLSREFKAFYADQKTPMTTEKFLQFIEDMIASDVNINISEEKGKAGAQVKLLTAHKSKGMEFDSVFLIECRDNVWGAKSKNQSSNITLPSNLQYIDYQESGDDEKIRKLYVAQTRAKTNLILTVSPEDPDKEIKRLSYINFSLIPNINHDPSDTKNLKLRRLAVHEKLELKGELKEILKNRLVDYRLSPTDFNTFLDLVDGGPASFFRRCILKYPDSLSPQVKYGSAIHETLDWMHKEFLHSKTLPPLEKVKDKYVERLSKMHLFDNQFNSYKEKGFFSLETYYQHNKNIFSQSDLSELSFSSENIKLGEANVTGKIDLLRINDDSKAIIVDYKTGKPFANWVKSEKKLHMYKHQLYFYAELLRSSKKYSKYKDLSAIIEFIDPDDDNKILSIEFSYDDDERENFLKLVNSVWLHIKDLNFPDVENYGNTVKSIVQFENDLIKGDI